MIPFAQCQHRHLYQLSSRNLGMGVFNAHTRGFVGIREKFGAEFLFTEYHWDAHPVHGTACPLQELEPLPEEIPIDEALGSYDLNTRRPVAFDGPLSQGGRGWYFTDDGEPSPEIRPAVRPNTELFQWLKARAAAR